MLNANGAGATQATHWHDDDLLTTGEVAWRVGVKVRAVQTWIEDGTVAARLDRVQGRRRYLLRWGDARRHAESIGPLPSPTVITPTPTTQPPHAAQNGAGAALVEMLTDSRAVIVRLQEANLSLTHTAAQQQATLQTLAQTVQAQQTEMARLAQEAQSARDAAVELDIKFRAQAVRADAARQEAPRRGWRAWLGLRG